MSGRFTLNYGTIVKALELSRTRRDRTAEAALLGLFESYESCVPGLFFARLRARDARYNRAAYEAEVDRLRATTVVTRCPSECASALREAGAAEVREPKKTVVYTIISLPKQVIYVAPPPRRDIYDSCHTY